MAYRRTSYVDIDVAAREQDALREFGRWRARIRTRMFALGLIAGCTAIGFVWFVLWPGLYPDPGAQHGLRLAVATGAALACLGGGSIAGERALAEGRSRKLTSLANLHDVDVVTLAAKIRSEALEGDRTQCR